MVIAITFIAVSPVADQEGEGQGCDAPSLKQEKKQRTFIKYHKNT